MTARPAHPEVTWPDTELVLCEWLRSRLHAPSSPWSECFVGHRVPKKRRDLMVIVRNDGGPRLSAVTRLARVGVTVWAPTEPKCTELAGVVSSRLGAIDLAGTPVRSWNEVSGPSWAPDESEHPRLYLTAEAVMRALPLP